MVSQRVPSFSQNCATKFTASCLIAELGTVRFPWYCWRKPLGTNRYFRFGSVEFDIAHPRHTSKCTFKHVEAHGVPHAHGENTGTIQEVVNRLPL